MPPRPPPPPKPQMGDEVEYRLRLHAASQEALADIVTLSLPSSNFRNLHEQDLPGDRRMLIKTTQKQFKQHFRRRSAFKKKREYKVFDPLAKAKPMTVAKVQKQVIELRGSGVRPAQTIKSIASDIGLKLSTVKNILARWQRNGRRFDWVKMYKRRPRKLVDRAVKDWLMEPERIWLWRSFNLLKRCRLIEERWRISVTPATLSKFYKQNRASHKVGSYRMYDSKTPQQTFTSRLRFVLTLMHHVRADREIIFLDETSFHRWQWQRK